MKDSFHQDIKLFRDDFVALGFKSMPLKCHVLVVHVLEFCEKYGRGLGLYSEQACEATHYDWKMNVWEKSYKRGLHHHDYSKNLFHAGVAYNSNHV